MKCQGTIAMEMAYYVLIMDITFPLSHMYYF